MKYHVTLGTRTVVVECGDDGSVSVDGRATAVDAVSVDGLGRRSVIVGGRSLQIDARPLGAGRWSVDHGGQPIIAEVVDERTRDLLERTARAAGPAGPKALVAPMPGLVIRVAVEPGASVNRGQGLVIVEAMKMENELRAEGDGVVTAVHALPGESVEKGQVLVEFEAVLEGGAAS